MATPPICLVGMPAVGKSTLGRQIAQAYHLSFIDLDAYIEQVEQKSIAEIFVERGEEFFRQKEAESLAKLSQLTDLIIATGGGTPCFYNNMPLMLRSSQVIFLDFPLQLITERLQSSGFSRPMFAQKSPSEIAETVQSLYQKRLPYYRLAHYVVKNEQELWQLLPKLI